MVKLNYVVFIDVNDKKGFEFDANRYTFRLRQQVIILLFEEMKLGF